MHLHLSYEQKHVLVQRVTESSRHPSEQKVGIHRFRPSLLLLVSSKAYRLRSANSLDTLILVENGGSTLN